MRLIISDMISLFDGKVFEISPVDEILSYEASIDKVLDFLTLLKTNENLHFSILSDLFAVDFLGQQQRFELVYSLLSLQFNKRVLIKIHLNEEEIVPSITKIFSNACWYEREVYDMYGINFMGSHDMRRILTDYGFEGHPLRKDFPVFGYVELIYDNVEAKVLYKPVELEEEYREFDFIR